MTNIAIRPSSVAPAAASYELAVLASRPGRILHTAGIVGTHPDGTISPMVEDQADEMWKTVRVLLVEAEMDVTDIVSYTTYTVIGSDLQAVMAARDRFFGSHRAASTLVTVPALVRPEWLVEVTVVAMD